MSQAGCSSCLHGCLYLLIYFRVARSGLWIQVHKNGSPALPWSGGYHRCRCSSLATISAPTSLGMSMGTKVTQISFNLATECMSWPFWVAFAAALDCCSWRRSRRQALATGTPPVLHLFLLGQWTRACRHLSASVGHALPSLLPAETNLPWHRQELQSRISTVGACYLRKSMADRRQKESSGIWKH